ncbi:hypothetical protein Tco_1033853 [Tanacetum coccineum]
MLTRVLRIILVIMPEHLSDTLCIHSDDGNPSRVNIKQLCGRDSFALSWKPLSRKILLKLNLPGHRYKRRCCSLTPAESDSLPHAHTQATKTYYKHQDFKQKKS